MGGTRSSRRSSVSTSSSSAVSWPFLFAADKPHPEPKTSVKTPNRSSTVISSSKSKGRSTVTVVVESSAPVKLWPFFMLQGKGKTGGYYESAPPKKKKRPKRSAPKELEMQTFPFFAQEKRKVLFVKERDEYYTY